MSVRGTPVHRLPVGSAHALQTLAETMPAMDVSDMAEPLGEGNGFAVAEQSTPLRRTVNVSIQASLNDFCLQRNRGTWAPSPEALKAIFQQKKFTSLDGQAERQGDLKSVVLHNMHVHHVRSTFPLALGAKITGVDDASFSQTGESFATIVMPNCESIRSKPLQADDTALAYEFAKKFPGYTADNLGTFNVHPVGEKRFVLIAADHPIISAISENAEKLQIGEISMMPEGLVKISSSLFEHILPLVKGQVETQIKVRDMSNAQVSVKPADYSSWSEARNELIVDAKRPLKAALAAELSAQPDHDKHHTIRAKYEALEANLEHDIDYKPMRLDMEVEMEYNFLG